MLKEALIDLLEEKPLKKITVYELCDKAQINRTTFYKYYGSPYDLLSELTDDLFSKLEEYLSGNIGKDPKSLLFLFQYLEMERRNFLAVINAVPEQILCERLFELDSVRWLVDERTSNETTPAQREYLRLFLCQGGYAITRKWLSSFPHESPQEISDLLVQLFNSFDYFNQIKR